MSELEITGIRVTLPTAPSGHLVGSASVEFNRALVVFVKVVSTKTRPRLLAMPSKKVSRNCPACRANVPLLDKYCGSCGTFQGNPVERLRCPHCTNGNVVHASTPRDGPTEVISVEACRSCKGSGQANPYVDTAFPTNVAARRMIEAAVFAAIDAELAARSKLAKESR